MSGESVRLCSMSPAGDEWSTCVVPPVRSRTGVKTGAWALKPQVCIPGHGVACACGWTASPLSWWACVACSPCAQHGSRSHANGAAIGAVSATAVTAANRARSKRCDIIIGIVYPDRPQEVKKRP